jgi:hypothetical protein
MIAEYLVMPCIGDMVSCVLGDKHLKAIKKVPLSNSTVSRRIEDITCNVKCELINPIGRSEDFAMQLDESTDVAGLSVLLEFVTHMYNN